MLMTNEQILRLAQSLKGSCDHIDDVCEKLFGHIIDEYENEDEIIEGVETVTKRCDCCCWWLEPDEIDDGECMDCR